MFSTQYRWVLTVFGWQLVPVQVFVPVVIQPPVVVTTILPGGFDAFRVAPR